MSKSTKNRRKPAVPKYGPRRWTAVAGFATLVLLTATALAAVPSMPAATGAAAVPVPAQDSPPPTPPAPVIGEPYVAGFSDGALAVVTIHSARFTSPSVLALDVGWEAISGVSTPGPDQFIVEDAAGRRAPVHTLARGALPGKPIEPGNTPARGQVAYDIPSGPAVLVITPSGAKEATRITVQR